jgi:hypothetical protein
MDLNYKRNLQTHLSDDCDLREDTFYLINLTFWRSWLSYCKVANDNDAEEKKADRMQPIAIGNERLRMQKGSIMVKAN